MLVEKILLHEHNSNNLFILGKIVWIFYSYNIQINTRLIKEEKIMRHN